ncbi:MAG: carbohydrate kinase family protein [Cyclobacteriaceae bacterium]|nr:carbohydrate kinase family protein [Cyclobacteriaceae bacterium]
MRNGIYAAGNWIIDDIKIIDEYPHQDGLANVRSVKSNNGGAPYNILKDLAMLKAPFPLHGAGLAGDDEKGKFIINDLEKHGINTGGIHLDKLSPTSYTDVMTVASTGRRTFFHHRGSNAFFGPEHIDFKNNARIFHMAYLLLLDKMDEIGEDGRTVASHVFEKAQASGFLTSSDIVSEASDRFNKVVPSSLPYLNYLFVNEYEASKITGINIIVDGNISQINAERVLDALIDAGVNDYVILHFPKGAIACNSRKEKTIQPAINVPGDLIKGTAGAGDAFAAGVLLGLHENWPIADCLRLGVCVAACSLFDESCSDGVVPMADCLKLADQFGF